ncbi:putative beta-lactamase domain protein [Monocercomonoides exilis]|uniref:putative beta-lactamase domain protein n=1 Tax=Monocercomonoides exilis TaxID=2049356 RepID=UPI00355AA6EE|nr:putative beta-lactamase domain protein [Monocercomonoides exilis]|eukprot:MONOS_4367.1-p1 / transcript=MONOS_4367.1 / gene=MONOS_4367 / organism=Monocercomonoides_exilis_PA203 / gene_product=beta-lactamase domain protein / transcript_product=beta-lactamase domain protein / location=Mono_scaffold00115:62113-63115(+) / protein_length=208 / sequence_SO=supercontig / SO=protein_coding / is_pseudo=false
MPLCRITLPVGEISSNTTILYDSETRDSVIFDAGGDIPKIAHEIQKEHLNVKHIYYTHGHYDHVDLSGQLQEVCGCEVSIHEADMFLYELSPKMKKSRGFSIPSCPLPKISTHKEGEKVIVGEYEGKIILTPGHSPGSCCFSFDHLLIAGDTLFKNGFGRTDLPGGSMEQIFASLRKLCTILPESTVVVTGHGEETTIGAEKKTLGIF